MFRVKPIDIDAGEPVVILHTQDTAALGLRELDRVQISRRGRVTVAIVQETSSFVKPGEVGVLLRTGSELEVKAGDEVDLRPAARPASIEWIKRKMDGAELSKEAIYEIVRDVVQRNLSPTEVSAYITATYVKGMTMRETKDLTMAMVETGEQLHFGDREVYDFHSVGGCPGNKVSLLVVPIVAATGLLIPKTSSRAISSAAGTADIMETVCSVELSLEEIRRIALEVGGCIAWGGAVRLAPADDLFIRVEYPLSIDPHSQLLASIMAKKKAVGAKHLVVDIPMGRGTKVTDEEQAKRLAKDLIELGDALAISTQCAVTYGGQPVGRAVGPILEMVEALRVLEGADRPTSVVRKATGLAGMVLEMGGIARDGPTAALALLKEGRALKKFQEIVAAQGGKEGLRSGDLAPGPHSEEVHATEEGYVDSIDNTAIVRIVREAGAPQAKGAGLVLAKKSGRQVERGEVLLTIYAEHKAKLDSAVALAKRLQPIRVESMILDRVHPIRRL